MPINTLSPTLAASISSDGKTLQINDQTVYGGANPVRSDLRVWLGIEKLNVDSERTPYSVTKNTGDSATATAWTATYTGASDGWTQMLYVATEEYNAGTTYDIYDAVHGANGIVYRSKASGNSGNSLGDTTWWEGIAYPEGLALNVGEPNESLNITSLIWNRNFSWNAQTKYADLIASNCSCTDCDDAKIIQPYNEFGFLLNGLILSDQRTASIEGETIARKLQSINVSDCGC